VEKPVIMYGTDYISFLIVGIAVSNLILPIVQGVQNLNPWTIETILMTGVSTPVFVIGNLMWTYIFSIISFIPYLFFGVFIFKVKLNANMPSVILAFLISAVIFVGLAMISTGLTIVTKSTDPITWSINALANILSGISFPVTYLNNFVPGLSTISWFIPQTWVYNLCRLAMLTNPSLLNPEILIQFLEGALFAIVLFPIGYKIFKWGLTRSKQEGTLGWY
jgi:ABC-type multidrug transport system permease subunit